MKQEKIYANSEDLKPQQSLEKILQLEIEIAEKIAAAKDKADDQLESTQSRVADLKTQVVNDARMERDQMIQKGIAEARQMAEQSVKNAQAEAEKYKETGGKFEAEAVQHVLNLVLGIDWRWEE